MAGPDENRFENDRIHRFLDERRRRQYEEDVDQINAFLEGGPAKIVLGLVVVGFVIAAIYFGFFA